MNCQEISELITAAVDQKLPDGERNQLLSHLIRCKNCRSEFRLEQATRAIVQKNSRRLSARLLPLVTPVLHRRKQATKESGHGE